MVVPGGLPAPKLPECNSTGGGDIQRIYAVRHGNLYSIITVGNGAGGKSITFGSENDSQSFFCHQFWMIDGDGVIT